MSRVVAVDDVDDPRLRDYLHLTDMTLRRLLEPEHGLFIAEGAEVVRRCLASHHRLRSAITGPRWLDQATDLVGDLDCDLYLVPDDVLTDLTGFPVHRGLLASVHRKPLASAGEIIASARTLAVLVDLVDHTNVGASFRSAAALGVDAVLVTPECADPLYRRSVRVSMGTVLQIPWTRAEPWPGCLEHLRVAGFTTAALTLAADATPLGDAAADLSAGRWAVLLGAEGHGLSADIAARCDVRVRIPMGNGVDSLNVAAASAVAFYALGAGSHPQVRDSLAQTQHRPGHEGSDESSHAARDRIVDQRQPAQGGRAQEHPHP